MTRPGIELRSRGPLANTLPTRPMTRYKYIYERAKEEFEKSNKHISLVV